MLGSVSLFCLHKAWLSDRHGPNHSELLPGLDSAWDQSTGFIPMSPDDCQREKVPHGVLAYFAYVLLARRVVSLLSFLAYGYR